MEKQPRFSSQFATILTMIGVAVGLGNVWRFPYMMGKYGGSAFLVIYIVFVVACAIPAIMAEWALGREARKGPVGAFSQAFGSRWGILIGSLLLITVLIANSYYLAVIANVVFTTVFSAASGFSTETLSTYNNGIANGLLQYGIALGILLISLWVIFLGLNRGIEKVSSVFVPFFLVTILYLIYHALTLEGAWAKFLVFLKPDFSALAPQHIFAALGQAFFSMSLGGTFLLRYGSYLPERENIPRSALWMGFGDTGAALLASLFIFPVILVFGMDMTSGPRLIFETLPLLFSQMPGGRLLGTLFLLALAMVAFLSNIASLEVLAGGLSEGPLKNWSRRRILLMLGIVEGLLIFPSANNPAVIGILDLIFGSGMQVLGSALSIIALVWGFGKAKTAHQLWRDKPRAAQQLFLGWLGIGIPLILFLILVQYIATAL